MPTAEEKDRGGVKRYRTVKLPGNKYMHVSIVPKAGPRGGHTVAGPVRTSGSDEVDWEGNNKEETDKKLRKKGY